MLEILLEMGEVLGEFVGALGGFLINAAVQAGDHYFLWLVPLAVTFLLTSWAFRPGRAGLRWGIWLLGHGVSAVFIIAAARVYQRPLDDFALKYYGEIRIEWFEVWMPAFAFWYFGWVAALVYDWVRGPSRYSSLPSAGTPLEPPPPPRREKGKKGRIA